MHIVLRILYGWVLVALGSAHGRRISVLPRAIALAWPSRNALPSHRKLLATATCGSSAGRTAAHEFMGIEYVKSVLTQRGLVTLSCERTTAEANLMDVRDSASRISAAAYADFEAHSPSAQHLASLMAILEASKPPIELDLNTILGKWYLIHTDELPALVRKELSQATLEAAADVSLEMLIGESGVLELTAVISMKDGGRRIVRMHCTMVQRSHTLRFAVNGKDSCVRTVAVTYLSSRLLIFREDTHDDEKESQNHTLDVLPTRAPLRRDVWKKADPPSSEVRSKLQGTSPWNLRFLETAHNGKAFNFRARKHVSRPRHDRSTIIRWASSKFPWGNVNTTERAEYPVEAGPDGSTPAEWLRFLISRGGDPEKALAMLKAHRRWRSANLPLAENSLTFGRGLPALAIFLSGVRCRKGMKVLLVLGAMYDPNLGSAEEYALALAAYLDSHLPRDSDEKITVLVDVRGSSGFYNPRAQECLAWIQLTAGMLSDNFPERLLRVVIYPMPWILTAVWTTVSKFLDPRTAGKCKILRGPTGRDKPIPAAITQFIDRGALEVCNQARAMAQSRSRGGP